MYAIFRDFVSNVDFYVFFLQHIMCLHKMTIYFLKLFLIYSVFILKINFEVYLIQPCLEKACIDISGKAGSSKLVPARSTRIL